MSRSLPVPRDWPARQRIRQQRRHKSQCHVCRAHIDCYPEASEAIWNQPPVERYQSSFREVKPNIEEIRRYEYSLSEDLVSYARVEDVVLGLR
jgi:hypothetical protein